MNRNEREARARHPDLFENPLIRSPTRAAREANIRREIDRGVPPAQAVAIGYSVQRKAAMEQGRAKRTSKRATNPTRRGLGYAVLSGTRVHSIWPMRPDAVATARSLADSIGSPVRVVAGAYTWADD